jgi:hypothetical protein
MDRLGMTEEERLFKALADNPSQWEKEELIDKLVKKALRYKYVGGFAADAPPGCMIKKCTNREREILQDMKSEDWEGYERYIKEQHIVD